MTRFRRRNLCNKRNPGVTAGSLNRKAQHHTAATSILNKTLQRSTWSQRDPQWPVQGGHNNRLGIRPGL